MVTARVITAGIVTSFQIEIDFASATEASLFREMSQLALFVLNFQLEDSCLAATGAVQQGAASDS
jgi:hypothetical protein